MNIWILHITEPVPTADNEHRLLRYGQLAELLLDRGHTVVRWRSTFDGAFSKKQLRSKTCIEDIAENYQVVFLQSPGYQKNISIQRIRDHRIVADKFLELAEKFPKPDLILCAMPTIEFSVAAAKFANKHNIPLVSDLRDMWPDIYLRFFPESLHWIAKYLLLPAKRRLSFALKNADGIVGITQPYLDWGLNYAKRAQGPHDRVFYNAHFSKPLESKKMQSAYEFWNNLGVRKDSGKFVVCYIGTLRDIMDIELLINAFNRLDQSFQLVIAGGGVAYQKFKDMADDSDNVVFSGFVDEAKIWSLMNIANVAVAPYKDAEHFEKSYPTKIIEYMAGALPVIMSLRGISQELILKHQCGFYYKNNDMQGFIDICELLNEDSRLLAEYSENARKLFDEKFSAETVFVEMANYLDDMSNIHANKLSVEGEVCQKSVV